MSEPALRSGRFWAGFMLVIAGVLLAMFDVPVAPGCVAGVGASVCYWAGAES